MDALWTTLWVDGHAGLITARHTSWIRRFIWWIGGGRNHRLLSITGPLVLIASILLWALLLWTGWVLLFSADPHSLLHSHRGTPATLANRIYFTGYTMFTLGNGDYSPQGALWQLVTVAASMSGLVLVTLVVTYQVSLLQGVTQKRSFASQVVALGRTPQDILVNSWQEGGFPGIELQIVSLTEQLNTVSERHEAYPMLHYYHEAREYQSVPVGLALFDEFLTLLAFAVREDCRPAPSAIQCARESVGIFLNTLTTAFVSAADEPAPALDLEELRRARIPTVSDAEFAARLQALDKRRRLLKGFLEAEQRSWPIGQGRAERPKLSGG